MKTCPRCRCTLPLEAFAHNKGRKLGRDCYCKECRRAAYALKNDRMFVRTGLHALVINGCNVCGKPSYSPLCAAHRRTNNCDTCQWDSICLDRVQHGVYVLCEYLSQLDIERMRALGVRNEDFLPQLVSVPVEQMQMEMG